MGANEQRTRDCVYCRATVPLEQLVQINGNENSLACQDIAGCMERQGAQEVARVIDSILLDNPKVTRQGLLAALKIELEG